MVSGWTPAELEAMQNRAAETSLHFFVRLMWPVLEPATPFADGWWPRAWCQHLEAVEDGRITRIIGNVPPGATKSLLTNCFYPAWCWGPLGKPHLRFLAASYSQTITERDNERTRQLIQSEEYQRRWGHTFKANDSKILLANNRTGWKLATGIGGTVTGLRADRFIIDDPNDIKAADSPVVRETTNRWLSETMPTRLNDLERSAIILIQQRTHQEDATGYLLDPKRGGDKWTYVMCPMVYDPDWTCGETAIGWSDPRTKRGELFWPERFSARAVASLREDLTDYAFASQQQQNPEPRGGAIIKRDWWKLYGRADENPQAIRLKFPPFSFLVASLDSALTDRTENDPSAMVVLGIWTVPETGEQAVMVVHCWAERLQFHELVTRVAATCDKYRVNLLLVENKANGHSVEQELRRLYQRATWGTIFTDPTRQGEKVARVHSITHLFQEGMIWAPNTGWADDIRDESAIFPRGSHDDRVDALVQALRYIRDNGILYTRREERWRETELAELARGQVQRERPLYAA